MTYKELYDYINTNINDENLKTILLNKVIQIQAGFGTGIDENSGNSLEELNKLAELYNEVKEIELLQFNKNRNAYTDYVNSYLQKKTESNTGTNANKKFYAMLLAIIVIFWLRA